MGIRPKSIVIFQNRDKFLFTIGYEKTQKSIFYIPVGGEVEFGEYSHEAAKREVFEETGLEIEHLELIHVLENVFTYNGIRGHEIVFVYKKDLKKQEANSILRGRLNDDGNPIKLTWASVDEIKEKEIQVYPSSLLSILEQLEK